MDSNREIRKKAFDRLRGRWGKSVLASLVAYVLGGAGVLSFMLEPPVMLMLGNTGVWGVLALVVTLHIIIGLFIGGMVELGHDRYYLIARKGADPGLGELFSLRAIWFRCLTLRLLLCGEILLRTLLLIVPGIIAQFQYALAPFLMAQNPAMEAPDALKTSSILMKGYKAKLWKFIWGYFFYFLLSICTLGLGFIILAPYFRAGLAEFYAQRIAEHDADVRNAQHDANMRNA